MPLTDTAIKQAKPSEKTRKLSDQHGLYLEVTPAGGKWWRHKFRFEGKETRLSLGVYPEISLAEARRRHMDQRQQLANGINPSVARKEEKIASLKTEAVETSNFESITREWYKVRRDEWSDSYGEKIIR